METKHISSNLTSEKIMLKPESAEIEVPMGIHHYHFSQHQVGDTNYVFHLRHSETQIKITGLVEATGENAPRLTTTVIHHAPRTRAETLIRTLSRDTAQPGYQGMIKIEEGAQECESYLNHHSLLLGETAQSWTRPSLEIKADNVKCSHAATVRTITDLDLFYLRSRGISTEEGRNLLIEAFLHDVQD